jgi:hypothetical protein
MSLQTMLSHLGDTGYYGGDDWCPQLMRVAGNTGARAPHRGPAPISGGSFPPVAWPLRTYPRPMRVPSTKGGVSIEQLTRSALRGYRCPPAPRCS